MSSKPTFGKKVLSSINERIEPVPGPVVETTPDASEEQLVWVSFTTAVTRETYLKLKQAEYWIPGFLMKELTEAALVKELATHPEADRPLPDALLQKLLRTNKKLQ
ncbi:hypothetical protein HHL22_21880 [Hymenobacter sp. RP-2-7]|uniref:Uncharacterized protein n=1 Tax=Hymenobacter polaris TaxID=2682546 RepID=A0A7Y0FPR3_9BACT|nr:hypothetical protein [Hymenobacter polaris]NML67860.1 hypothetical protein [Hymenobacter polaris]